MSYRCDLNESSRRTNARRGGTRVSLSRYMARIRRRVTMRMVRHCRMKQTKNTVRPCRMTDQSPAPEADLDPPSYFADSGRLLPDESSSVPHHRHVFLTAGWSTRRRGLARDVSQRSGCRTRETHPHPQQHAADPLQVFHARRHCSTSHSGRS